MEVKNIQSQGLSHNIEVVISAQELQSEVQNQLVSLQQQVKIDGFRPGKVPFTVVEKKYGAAARREALQGLIEKATQKALSDNKIKPFTKPQYDIPTYEEGKDFAFSMTVESLPNIQVADYSNVRIQRLNAKVEEKQVEEGLAQLVKQMKRTQKVEQSRKSKVGDTLVTNMKGYWGHTGEKLIPHSEIEKFPVELGANRIVKELEDHLIGQEVPGTIEAKFTFPADFADKELAGQDARYVIEVIELREPREIVLNDEFAKEEGFENLDDLKKKIREDIEANHHRKSFFYTKRQLLDALDKENKFDLPQSMVQKEFDTIWEQFKKASEEDGSKISEEEERAQCLSLAERRVRLGLLLAHIGEKNNVKVSQEKFIAALLEKARDYPGAENQIFDYYRKNQQAAAHLHSTLFEDEVVNFILQHVQIEDKEVTSEELDKQLDALMENMPEILDASQQAHAHEHKHVHTADCKHDH